MYRMCRNQQNPFLYRYLTILFSEFRYKSVYFNLH